MPSRVQEHEDEGSYDFVNHTFVKPGERRTCGR